MRQGPHTGRRCLVLTTARCPSAGGCMAQREPATVEHVPRPVTEAEPAASAALYGGLDATRALLWGGGGGGTGAVVGVGTAADAAQATRNLVAALGGRVEPAAGSGKDGLPLDVS